MQFHVLLLPSVSVTNRTLAVVCLYLFFCVMALSSVCCKALSVSTEVRIILNKIQSCGIEDSRSIAFGVAKIWKQASSEKSFLWPPESSKTWSQFSPAMRALSLTVSILSLSPALFLAPSLDLSLSIYLSRALSIHTIDLPWTSGQADESSTPADFPSFVRAKH